MTATQGDLISFLFEQPTLNRWGVAFTAAAMGDPASGKALAPFLGPANVPIEGGTRPRVPGDVHFLHTWAGIVPGFTGKQAERYRSNVARTKRDHERTHIPPKLIALPIQWIVVMLNNTADDLGRGRALRPAIASRALAYAHDINADPKVVGESLAGARAAMAKHFAGVVVPKEPIGSFWDVVRRGNMTGRPQQIDVPRVKETLERHLPKPFAAQFLARAPRR